MLKTHNTLYDSKDVIRLYKTAWKNFEEGLTLVGYLESIIRHWYPELEKEVKLDPVHKQLLKKIRDARDFYYAGNYEEAEKKALGIEKKIYQTPDLSLHLLYGSIAFAIYAGQTFSRYKKVASKKKNVSLDDITDNLLSAFENAIARCNNPLVYGYLVKFPNIDTDPKISVPAVFEELYKTASRLQSRLILKTALEKNDLEKFKDEAARQGYNVIPAFENYLVK